MENALKIYQETNKKQNALFLAFFLHDWDTISAPVKALEDRAKQLSVLSGLSYEWSTSPEYEAAVETLYQNRERLDEVLAHEVSVLREKISDMKKIPKEEYMAYQELLAKLYPLYVSAKKTGDFDAFEPYFDRIFEFQRRRCSYLTTESRKGYDVLLHEYEPGMTQRDYDVFFDLLKRRLVPFVKKVLAKPLEYSRAFTLRKFPVEKQRAFVEYLRGVMGFDEARTLIRESEHPFTTNNGRNDVRITVHYYEDNLSSFIFSAIHEMGHGLYEMQVSPALDDTQSGGGAGMAMHESQSRFMENMIARSRAFWETHFCALRECFHEELADVTLDDFYAYINEVQAGFVRTEADELTYPLHVLIRYEIEREIIERRLSAREARTLWNAKYKEYLGLSVENDRDGILQDVHWAQGSVGYFPTYALGSAYAAQFYQAMAKDLDIDAALRTGSVAAISKWNETHIHQYGSSKFPREIIRLATGEDFDPNYYVDYLIGKYSALYGIKE